MLTREIIRRVREIQLRTGRQVADVLAGEYVSVFKGTGVEFDEVRPYVPGDDVRSIDWNVTARMGEPFVKRYVEERQLTIMIMADVSASQDFGSVGRSKREAAAELCALIAFSAIKNDDKVGLTLFHSEIEQYIPPRKGQKHALRVVREVLAHGLDNEEEEGSKPPFWKRLFASEAPLFGSDGFRFPKRLRPPREATRIATALEFLMSVRSRKSVCFLVSDFIDEGYEQALVAANRKHDVIGVLISDPREFEFPALGLVELRDAETGRTQVVDTASQAFRRDFERKSRERIEALERKLRGSGIDFIHVDASGSVVEPLIKFFRMRERRQRR
ncbi:MAG: DUF58 domain-containing protein [Myxococcota bacterium]|jgi:uncharacterized protein (DUF58 family)|nr:DUF58 domain-containing protein [Myxococcota bacterium]